jgi:endonuclease/exonuclease/phosphatase family metal-dependent hydrolase
MIVILRKVAIGFIYVVVVSYVLSSACSFISPSSLPLLSAFAFPFLFLFLAMLGAVLLAFLLRMKIAWVFLIFLPVGIVSLRNSIAFNNPSNWEVHKDSTTLRILSWNVMNFDDLAFQGKPAAANRMAMLGLIDSYRPDILCLQEYKSVERGKRRVSVRKELDSLGYHNYYFSKDLYYINPKSGREVTGGTAIFSKLPLTDTTRLKISAVNMQPEYACAATVLMNQKPLRIVTAHLASYGLGLHDSILVDDGYGNEVTIADSLHPKPLNLLSNTEKIHYHQIMQLHKFMKDDLLPGLFCGDINTTPSAYNYRFLRGGMQDAFLEKGLGIGTTFNGLFYTLRIDVCLVDEDFTVQQYTVPKKKFSDHYPVITDICWKQ